MQNSDMPGCCAALVLHGLNGTSTETIKRFLEDQKDPPASEGGYRGDGMGIALATTAKQPAAEKALKAAGFKMLMSAISNHGEYPVKVWGKSLRKAKPKPRAKKKSSLR